MRHKQNKKNNQRHQPKPNNTQPAPKLPGNIVADIPQPFAVVQDSTPEDEAKYFEERNSRAAQLSTSKWQNLITAAGQLVALASLAALFVSLLQSRDALRQSRVAMMVEQRAWIKVELTWSSEIPMDGNVGIRISNVGKSAALASDTQAMIEVVPSTRPPSLKLFGDADHWRAELPILFPEDKPTATVERYSPRGGPIGISDSERRDLEAGRSYLAAFGVTAYTDQFGRHWTKFCSWQAYTKISGTFSAKDCVKFNSVGDGPTRMVAPDGRVSIPIP